MVNGVGGSVVRLQLRRLDQGGTSLSVIFLVNDGLALNHRYGVEFDLAAPRVISASFGISGLLWHLGRCLV